MRFDEADINIIKIVEDTVDSKTIEIDTKLLGKSSTPSILHRRNASILVCAIK